MRTIAILLIVLLAAAVGHADDEPLRVYAYGAAGAAVYVVPAAAAGAEATADSEIGARAFAKKFLRGTAPLELRLKPGPYLVSVVLSREQNMRDASLWANEFVWDGYDHHVLVPQKSGNWRYAQSYRVQKTEGFPAEVLAVFTDRMPLDEALCFDCGPKTTRYTGSEEDAATALTGAEVPMTYHDDIIRGLQAGMKVLLRAGERRFTIQPDGTVALRVTAAFGQGAWAGHRLGIVSYE